MANKRALSWSAALRDLKDDRSRRADVREERLKTAAGLRGSPATTLSAWRGRSGRRYVVGVHELAEPELNEVGEAVVLAVRRDPAGIGELVAVAAAGQSPRERLHGNWIARARHRGATEMHVHRLAETEAERSAIVADLDAEPSAANQA
ncbi:hypothetical protein [Methylobacterium iners]|jgi:hypothetical protein|uniref:hypothetical protein n=1 Tax=Methylobacterium iners TaxID=418707 RepID=UPI001EE212F5|nr:hypothetical protein [Methylobacterium iners]